MDSAFLITPLVKTEYAHKISITHDRKIKNEDENKIIGIILCKDRNETIIKMTLPEENTQIFASKYQLILPSKEELKKIMED